MANQPGRWPSIALLGADAEEVARLAAALRPMLAQAGIPAELDTQSILVRQLQARITPLQTSCLEQPEAPGSVLQLLLALSPLARSSQREQQAWLRQTLDASAAGYQVIHGQGTPALEQAFAAVQAANPVKAKTDPGKRQPWVWNCEKCSDSACEHRWLTDLLASREARD